MQFTQSQHRPTNIPNNWGVSATSLGTLDTDTSKPSVTLLGSKLLYILLMITLLCTAWTGSLTAQQSSIPEPAVGTNGIASIEEDDFPETGAGKVSQPSEDKSESAAGIQSDEQTEVSPDEQVDPIAEAESTSTGSIWSYQKLTDRKSLPSTLQMMLSFASISLVPAILLMTTCFIRIVVVLGILRQAIGLQQLPPAQVTTALALMMTFLVMSPYWAEVKRNAIDPYSAEGSTMTWDEAWENGITPIKQFMWNQIDAADNQADYWLFFDHLPEEEKSAEPTSIQTAPLKVLMPAFMISELKVAFLIGAQIYLPFLIIDILVASFSNTMGLLMLPPTVTSLPLKLILFVLVDGWHLIVGLLLNSFVPFS